MNIYSGYIVESYHCIRENIIDCNLLKMIAVSVIVPIYNAELYIERCVRSLMEQTLENMEYIFVDDYSQDESVRILKNVVGEYPSRKDYIKIVEQKENHGVATARKIGLSLAKGEYVIQCDSDDWVDKNMYHILYEKAISLCSDCVICDYYETDGRNCKSVIYDYESKRKLLSDLLSYKRGGSMCFYLVKRELFDNNIVFPVKHMWEDLVVSVQLFFYAKKISKIDECLYFYYQNPQSVSYYPSLEASIKRLEESKINVVLIENFLKKNKVDDLYKQEIVCLKYFSKFFISQYISQKEMKILWHNTFREISLKILFYIHIPLDIKVKYVLLYLGLFPVFKSFIKKVR